MDRVAVRCLIEYDPERVALIDKDNVLSAGTGRSVFVTYEENGKAIAAVVYAVRRLAAVGMPTKKVFVEIDNEKEDAKRLELTFDRIVPSRKGSYLLIIYKRVLDEEGLKYIGELAKLYRTFSATMDEVEELVTDSQEWDKKFNEMFTNYEPIIEAEGK